MELTQSQKEIVSDTSRFRVVNCGRRFGKSTLAALEMIGKAVAKDDTRIAYIANTYQQARDIVWEMLKKFAGQAIYKVNESRLEIIINTQDGGKSTITLRGWENVETARGLKFHFLVLDEVASMKNFWMNWQEVLRPTLTDYKGEVLFLSTPKGFNHFYDIYNLEKDKEKGKNFKSFHYTSYDNDYLPREEIETAKQELTEDRFAQEYMADFRKMEGLVYKEFDRNKHLYTDKDILPRSVAYIQGIDFGYTNPAAILKIMVDGDSNYWI